MPKSTKDHLKRKTGHAYANLGRAIVHLGDVQGKFNGVHDDYAEFLENIILTLTMSLDFIEKFWALAWGRFPDDVERWRNTGESWRHENDGKGK